MRSPAQSGIPLLVACGKISKSLDRRPPLKTYKLHSPAQSWLNRIYRMIKIYFDWPDASQNVSIAFGKKNISKITCAHGGWTKKMFCWNEA
jgi:hypothetical protein